MNEIWAASQLTQYTGKEFGMKQFLGFLLIVGGVILGFYVGGYLCLVKGIISIIEQIQAPAIEASVVAWGCARILLAGACGGVSALVCVVPGLALIKGN